MNLSSQPARHLQVCTVKLQIKLKWRYILKRAHPKSSILLSLLTSNLDLSFLWPSLSDLHLPIASLSHISCLTSP